MRKRIVGKSINLRPKIPQVMEILEQGTLNCGVCKIDVMSKIFRLTNESDSAVLMKDVIKMLDKSV